MTIKTWPKILAAIALAVAMSACSTTSTSLRAPTEPMASPLGPSYILVPLPSDDPSLIGRVLPAPPEPGRSLDELAQPNPCAGKLAPAQESTSAAEFEGAEEVSLGAQAGATLGLYGFRADAERATHLVYKLSTERQIVQRDTVEYLECCKAASCGFGYVSGLVYGSGEYASAEETRGSAEVDAWFASGEGSVKLKVLTRRKVKGWVAAIIRVTQAGASPAALGVLGVPSSEVDLSSTAEKYKEMYEKHRVEVCSDRVKTEWSFCDVRGPITEDVFIERYTAETGSDELEGRGPGTPGLLWVGIGSLPAAGGLFATGLALGIEGEESGELGVGFPFILLGAVGGLLGTSLGLAFGGVELDDVHRHGLSESDGRFYADRYNRALLRRIARDAQRSSRFVDPTRPSITVGVAPSQGGLGLHIGFIIDWELVGL